ncbi:excinuclease ABC subunit UvrA [Ethanoligenens harbinense]|uniref:UvrABC system protein A n=1 Tax=Ethanoligenens harbinense (strain DSM 18485 / JCM 12961 / CGMCC 1.5033 / YUAN-3) TaxID=663278 RepID=E6U840_ETHHY|nr:excinuclease ABC subunit UvrA [Ethanoligenens harbinense]ADU27059.1 excinuclease ABC, A subunit [Ethanoligenens harbinense YUAN-3]AVQ96139.1 excinuclease ABC subunit UvrA [Ethanoligenens harbinense YUAN-3]AYF38799.1 excinuclease ABC subunit UvrA [Ethanoligenens harbinense]AYF41549.1 excinuclease ABC subunit UvrA [Ethanoligenens harbinense]QCN92380.1 excinuclease ABC subunit UvrA [Ethanoligenens harbinense]
MPKNTIFIKGARAHNLKNVDLELPRDKLIVFTGLSGSGKSSLAFDTIYAEGQRRYVESLSSYARQFLGQMDKPDVDYIDGLSPAISIDQKTTSNNPRSTVGTVTEIYDYLRLLYARIGIPHCPVCGREIRQQTIDQIVDQVLALPEGTKLQILAPVVRARKGEHQKEFEAARRGGFARVRVDGNLYDLTEEIKPTKNQKHNIEIVVDRLVVKPEVRGRLADSLETATALSGGLAIADVVGGEEILFSQNYACPEHGVSMEELSPRMFSFNNPYGACETCGGLGFRMRIDPERIIPDKTRSIEGGAVQASGWNALDGGSISHMYYTGLAEHYGFSLSVPVKDLPKKALDVILFGTGDEKITLRREGAFGSGTFHAPFEGVVNNLERRYKETQSDWMRAEIESCMSKEPCPTCHGARLKKEVLAVTVGGLNIDAFCRLSITKALAFLDGLELTPREQLIAGRILKEVRERLGFLKNVGLEYLTLSRAAATLSGGESQRIRLATQIGSSLVGVLYILDEPSIGLHQRDNDRLLATLRHLRDIGNTLIVVEHDEDTMYAADWIVDVGPGAGVHGGQIICAGTVEDIKACPESVTGQYLSGVKRIEVPESRRKGNGHKLVVKGARENNLKGITVKVPLGTFTCVTGVSGSGKSSLVNEIIHKRLAAELNGARTHPGAHSEMTGIEYLDKVIDIDQSPIGRTPRSNPATYTGVFTDIRSLFAATQDAKMRGYTASRFSFNVKGGRCEACQGDGIIKIEMHFLPDVYVPCDVCKGHRYNRETLEVKYKGKSIYDVLEMTVEEGLSFFENVPRVQRKLQTLFDVGLGYVKIGQPATTLSGGEAQRVKLATELARRSTGKTIYILDEPTTGLHVADVHRLIDVLQTLVDGGNTVLVIEHNLDVIKTADHLIDLGPEGGDGGGTLVVAGTPEEVAACEASYTGQYLKKYLPQPVSASAHAPNRADA